MDPAVATGVNIYTSGTDPPLLPDDQYPEWLWGLLKKRKTIKQLEAQADELGGYVDMPPDDYFWLLKLINKRKIKAANEASTRR